MRTKEDILQLVGEEDVEFVRLQFTDMFGNLKNISVTVEQLKRVLENNCVFDGSSMFGAYREDEEDMYLCPDLDTFVILPWKPQQDKVARMLCNVYNADGTPYEMCPRTILQKVVKYAEEQGYTFYIDPECEFFMFHTDADGIPTTVTHEQAGYMDVGPLDLTENPRRDMALTLEEMGFEIETAHHETAPGQQEIAFREGEPMYIADSIVTFKYAVRAIARRFGLHATFMPKPKAGVAGSGMHLNISVYKDGKNIFNDRGDDQGVCDEAYWFVGGILQHVKEFCAISNPLVNSYKRLLSGFEAPRDITWTSKNKNTLIKVHKRLGEDTKVELRFPDPSANPYLVLALCLAAGMDGITNHTDPGEQAPMCYENGSVDSLPENLREAVLYMKGSNFVEKVLGEEFTHIYTEMKMREWNEYMIQVSDWEIKQYLNRI